MALQHVMAQPPYVGESTDDIVFTETDIAKWSPGQLREEFEKSSTVVNELFKHVQKVLRKNGTLPEFESLLEAQNRRLLQISRLAQKYIKAQEGRKAPCIDIAYRSGSSFAHVVSTMSFGGGIFLDVASLNLRQYPSWLILSATTVSGIQLVAPPLAARMGQRAVNTEEKIGKVLAVDTAARKLMQAISASLTQWSIRVKQKTSLSEEVFRIEDAIQNFAEQHEWDLPPKEALHALLMEYDIATLQGFIFSETAIGNALNEVVAERIASSGSIEEKDSSMITSSPRGGEGLSRSLAAQAPDDDVFPARGEERVIPNIGVTIQDWFVAVSSARSAVEMYITFIGEQEKSGNIPSIDFKRVITFLREQMCIVQYALELADEEYRARPRICGYDLNNFLSRMSLGTSFIAAGATMVMDATNITKRADDPFDAVQAIASLTTRVVAGVTHWGNARLTFERKKLEKKESRLENLKAEAETTLRVIEAHIRCFRAFVVDSPAAAEEGHRRVSALGETGFEDDDFDSMPPRAAAASARGVGNIHPLSSTMRSVAVRGERAVVDRMLEKLGRFSRVAGDMERKEYVRFLVGSYMREYPGLGYEHFDVTKRHEAELFRAFLHLSTSAPRPGAPRRGAGFAYASSAMRPVPSAGSAAPAHVRVFIGDPSDPSETASELDAIFASESYRGVIRWAIAQLGDVDERERSQKALELMRVCRTRFPSLAPAHFSDVRNEYEYELLEAFFKLA